MKKSEWLSIAAFGLSVLSFLTSYHLTVQSRIAAVRPVLVFEYAGTQGWVVRNVGSGPALDVTVQHREATGGWFNPVRIPPLAAGGSFTPGWLGQANVKSLGLSYADVEGRAYSSITANDLTTLKDENIFPRWKSGQVGTYWNQPPLSSGI